MRQWFQNKAEAAQHLRAQGYHPDNSAEWVWRTGPYIATISEDVGSGFVAEWFGAGFHSPYQSTG